ncbi:hypothetical protein Tco_0958411 [Tanacetum coccineum]
MRRGLFRNVECLHAAAFRRYSGALALYLRPWLFSTKTLRTRQYLSMARIWERLSKKMDEHTKPIDKTGDRNGKAWKDKAQV